MYLCDIGNTSYHFYNSKKSYKEDAKLFNPSLFKDEVFYICVNPNLKERLGELENWIDLSLHVDMKKYYQTMGIDRIMACEAIENGLILDAGSAITVDVVQNHQFMGGYIYPGVKAMQDAYKNISSVLEYSFNFEVDLDKMPKNSRDAISYGYLKTLHSEVMMHKMGIYLTGGYAKEFSKIFKDAQVDELLIFKGMKKIIKRANLC